MRALIVDDHPIARTGLRTVIAGAFDDVERIIEVDGGTKAIAAARALGPDLILMDLDLPEHPHGHTLCAQLRAASPTSRIVIVTAFARRVAIQQCLSAGADACVLKDTTNMDIGEALHAVVAGESVIDPRVAQMLCEDVGIVGGDGTVVRLTQRESEVLAALARGWSNRVIAEKFAIAEGTVKDHVGAVMAKLGADSRLHAVVRASEEGLL